MHLTTMSSLLQVLFLITSPLNPDSFQIQPQEGRLKLDRTKTQKIVPDLQSDGWQTVQENAPDIRVLDRDPAALIANPGLVKAILSSTAIGERDLENVASVAARSADPDVRAAAIESIGRVNTEKSRSKLVELYPRISDGTSRRVMLRYLKPQNEDDPVARLLYREVARADIAPAERSAMLGSIAAMAVRKYGKRSVALPPSVTSRVPAPTQNQLAGIYGTIRKGGTTVSVDSSDSLPLLQPNFSPDKINAFIASLAARRAQPHTEFRKVNEAGDVVTAPASEVSQPGKYRQVLVLPAGYTASDHDKYFSDIDKMIHKNGNLPDPVYTRKYRDRIIYIVHWMPGGKLGTNTANFGATTYTHPTRGGLAFTLRNPDVIAKVGDLQRTSIPSLAPIGVVTVFNFDDEATAYASPPTLLRQTFGIARISSNDIAHKKGRPAHELAHGSLNFLDEYIEPSLQGWDIGDVDYLTAAILPDGSWGSVRDAWESLITNYQIRLSEILADNGSGNISTRRYPATVSNNPPAYSLFKYENEGGMFFESGTFHDGGNNMMNNDRITKDTPLKSDGDRFAYDHNRAQKYVLNQVFGDQGTPRPNDRLRNAGPTVDWLPQFGDKVRLLIFDADKNHRWHPTTKYDVEVGWWEWVYEGTVLDPFKGEWKFRTVSKSFTPSPRTVDLSKTFAAGGAGLLRDALVFLGVQELGDGKFNLAATTVPDLLSEAIPSVVWPVPYQDVEVKLPSPNIYYWRFRTRNGTHTSAYTEYSRFTKI